MSSSRVDVKRAGLLALGLLVAGFCVGYGYGAGRRRAASSVPRPQPPPAPNPPLLKGLRTSPNGKLLAFTGVFDGSRQAARFVLEVESGRFDARLAPRGWQDYVSGWTPDGRVLFEREKIPRPVEDATAGIYSERIGAGPNGFTKEEPSLLSGEGVPDGEKVTGGFVSPDDRLVVKTRREPKALYALRDGASTLVDRTEVNFYQSRAVRENGRTVYYTAHDVPGNRDVAGLYRNDGSGPRRIGPTWSDPSWLYLRENALALIVCKQNPDESWTWTLYDVSPQKLTLRKTATVPADVIAVYWSPDGKTVLGAGGEDVWAVDVPSLRARKLPRRAANPPWNADDAAWLHDGHTAIIAADGVLWRVDANGQTPPQEAWRVPQRFWK